LAQTTTKDVFTVGDAILGTFEYMAPEQWRGAEEIVPASDIYSLGCTLFFALTGGKPPFVANSLVAYCNAHTSSPPPRLSEKQPGSPEALDTLLQQMLSKDPAKRGSPTQLIKEFSNLLRQESEGALPRKRTTVDADTPRPFRPRKRPPRQQGDTAAPLRSMDLPTAPADDRFSPFPTSSEVKASGPRAVWRALVASPRRVDLILFLLFLTITIAGGLLLLWRF
jgi:serine/threonine protein kinase